MRDTVASLFTSIVEVWRRVSLPDPGGGTTDTYSMVHTYKCEFHGAAGTPEMSLPSPGVIVVSQNYTFRFDRLADIKLEDRLKAPDGRVFEVKDTSDATEELQISLIVTANEVT